MPNATYCELVWDVRMSSDLTFLYDQVLESLVRVHAYGRWVDREDANEAAEDVDHMATLLARRDLLVLAASLRNFSELSRTSPQLRQESISLLETVVPVRPPFIQRARGGKNSISLYSALSRILHSVLTEISSDGRCVFMFCRGLEKSKISIINYIHNNEIEIGTIIYTINDQDDQSMFLLNDLLFSIERYLDYSIRELATKNVFVSKSLRDS